MVKARAIATLMIRHGDRVASIGCGEPQGLKDRRRRSWGRAHEAWRCKVFGFRPCTPCVSTPHALSPGWNVGAFASRRGAVLAQVAIGERENEVTQALPLLCQIKLDHVLVTGDALFAQRGLCTHTVEHSGQYLFEVKVKDNQPPLLQDLQRSFRDSHYHGGRAND